MNGERDSAENDFVHNFNFEKLIAPWTSERFFGEYFEKKALLISRNQQDFYKGLLSARELDDILFQFPGGVSVENEGTKDGAQPRMPLKIRQGSVQTVLREFDEGSRVVFENLDQRHPALTKLCALLEKEHAWRYQANVLLSPVGCLSSVPISESGNLFILGTAGSCTLRINRAARLTATGEGSLNPSAIDEENHDVFIMNPGDLVYIPRGFAHETASSEMPCVHIALRPHPPTWGEVLTFVVKLCADTRADLGLSTPPGFAELSATEVAENIKRRLVEVTNYELENEAQTFLNRRSEIYRGLFYGALEHKLQPPEPEIDALYVRNNYLKLYIELIDDEYRVHTPEKRVDLPIIFRKSIDFCLSGDRFSGSAIPGMDPAEQMILLNRLLAEGIVIRAEQG